MNHTEHCKARIKWGDGECACHLARRLLVTNRRCDFCGAWHRHRLFVSSVDPAVVAYATCPETKKMLTLHLELA